MKGVVRVSKTLRLAGSIVQYLRYLENSTLFAGRHVSGHRRMSATGREDGMLLAQKSGGAKA
jgi:hypothetical protein